MPRTKERSFGQVIRDRRQHLDLTQEDVGRLIKTSTPYLGHLESGKRHPSDKILARLADVLGLDRRELFFLANPRARAILSPELETDPKSAWEDFRKEEQLRRIHNISADEMEMLSRVALLGKKVKKMQEQGKLPIWPTDEQRADWAYGNTVIENAKVTLKMVKEAVTKKPSPA
jgi:transcriptional regulator with XRE-family HTH domain